MEWFKFKTSILRAKEVIGSAPVERSTWISLLIYCVDQENGGRLEGAARWKDRQWQQTCGVTLREVKSATKLVQFDGDDVVIWEYPLATQSECHDRRRASAVANGVRWGDKSHSVTESNTESATDSRVEESRVEESRGEESRGEESRTPLPPEGEELFEKFPSLNVPELRAAWDRWVRHRKEKKKPLTPTSVDQQFKHFAEWGPARAIAVIDYTIGKGWQGLADETQVPASATQAIASNAKQDWIKAAEELKAALAEHEGYAVDQVRAFVATYRSRISEGGQAAKDWLKQSLTPWGLNVVREVWKETK